MSNEIQESQSSFARAAERAETIQRFMKQYMIEGTDYGVIGEFSNKPCLFKPGAVKLLNAFGLATIEPKIDRIFRPDDNLVSYEVTVNIVNKDTGQPEASGVGMCSNRERKYQRQDAAGVANTILKMARKRALVDAVIDATGASVIFTQDLEDMPRDEPQYEGQEYSRPANHSSSHGAAPQQQQQRGGYNNNGSAPRGGGGRSNNSSNNVLTDAQHRAILAIANRVFGRPATGEDFAQLIDKPLEELTKGEASTLIDRLRERMAQNQAPQGNGPRY